MPSNFRDAYVTDLSMGMNTTALASQIDDNQVRDALNKEYRFEKSLSSRLGTTRLSDDSVSTTPWTSIYDFFNDAGTQASLATTSTKVFKKGATKFAAADDITGGGNFPNGTRWQWITFDDKAIGVNGGDASFDNPVEWPGTGNAQALTVTSGTAQPGKYIAGVNGRVFIAGSSADKNKLQWCHTDDSATWAAGSLADDPGEAIIGAGDGDYITGLFAHRQRLFIFKSRHIYELTFADPNRDQTLFSVQLLTSRVGCISAYSIQACGNDIVFMSEFGLVPLSAVQQFGDFSVGTSLSKNILELRDGIERSVDTYASAVLSDTNQYILSVPVDTATPSINTHTFVMDFKLGTDVQSVRWTRYDNRMIASCFGVVKESGQSRLYVGCAVPDGTQYDIQRYGDADNFADNAATVVNTAVPEAYDKEIATKEYNFGTGVKRKLFNYFGGEVKIPSDELVLTVTYKMDNNPDLTNQFQFSYLIPNPTLYGVALWDVDRFSDPLIDERDFVRRISKFRRAETIQFLFANSVIDQGFVLKEFWIAPKVIGKKFVDDSDTT